MTPYPAILMQGLPGCGKGTQGKMLGADDMFYHCSSGELFRNLDPESDLGQRVTSFISRGDLVPDKVAVRVWAHHIQRSIERGEYDPTRQILLLDGMPRNRPQAELLQHEIDVRLIIYLNVHDENQLIARIKNRAVEEHREDDADVNVIRHRIEVYHQETEPLFEFYPNDIIAEIDALLSPQGVHKQIMNAVKPLRALINPTPAT